LPNCAAPALWRDSEATSMDEFVEQRPDRSRVLLVNGNSSTEVTAHLATMAARCAPHLDFIPLTPAFGPRYILNPAEVAIGAHAVLDTVQTYCDTAPAPPDACIVACFGEVGMSALRHRFPFPVVNMAEAGIFTAMQLGARYGIIAIGDYWPAMLDEMVRQYGVAARYAGPFRIEGEPLKLLENPAAARRALKATVDAIPPGTVDVLIMGGAALTGIAGHVRDAVALPIVDCLHAALAQVDAAILYHRLADSYELA
jgi:Asp/Glu/hydantoin racemase